MKKVSSHKSKAMLWVSRLVLSLFLMVAIFNLHKEYPNFSGFMVIALILTAVACGVKAYEEFKNTAKI